MRKPGFIMQKIKRSKEMKTIEEFTKELSNGVLSVLPTKLSAELKLNPVSVTKVNDQEYHGISFVLEDPGMSPMYYVDDMYEEYNKGRNMNELIVELAQSYLMSLVRPDRRPLELKYDEAKNHLAFRVLDIRRNVKYLEKVPYINLGFDLALVPDIRMDDGNGGLWRTAVQHDMFKDMDDQEMFDYALKHARSVDPPLLTATWGKSPDSEEVVNLLDIDDCIRDIDKEVFYVLTNSHNLLGASVMFYPGVQEDVARVLGESYYAIPSSINEFLIIPLSSGVEYEYLRDLLEEANDEKTEPGEVLTDKVFFYDKETQVFGPWEDMEHLPQLKS